MKPIQSVLSLILFSLLFTSCVEVNLLDLIPEPSGSYCNQVNPDSSLDPLLWKASLGDTTTTVELDSKILVNADELVAINTFGEHISIVIMDRFTGDMIKNVDTEIESYYFDNAEIIEDRIIITGSKQLTAYDTDDYTLIWQKSIEGQMYFDETHLNVEGNLLIPIRNAENLTITFEMLSIDISNGQILDRRVLYQSESANNHNLKLVSIEIDQSTGHLLCAFKKWYPSNELDVTIISKDLESVDLNWMRKRTLSDKFFPGAIYTDSYAVVVSDSLYLLDKDSGTVLRSMALESTQYQHQKPILEEVGPDVILLKIYGQDIQLIDLRDLSILWKEHRYIIYGYEAGVLYEDNYYSSTNLALKKLNIINGTKESWTELPYNCSFLDTRLSIDQNHGVLYILDKSRLYALQLD